MGFLKELFCKHEYKLVGWGACHDMPSYTRSGSYILLTCKKCGKIEQTNIVENLGDESIEGYCKRKNIEFVNI